MGVNIYEGLRGCCPLRAMRVNFDAPPKPPYPSDDSCP